MARRSGIRENDHNSCVTTDYSEWHFDQLQESQSVAPPPTYEYVVKDLLE